jgi:sporulation protein YlmC with PRC-barrel domain
MGLDTPIPMADRSNVAHHETAQLIASDKVEGTAVYRSDGEKIGRIENVMIDKRSGKVAYAVLTFGGFFGIGADHYPLPWSLLTYNERLGGYEVNVTEEQLKGAPRYAAADGWDWQDYERGRVVYNYYGLVPYWI